MAGLFTLSWVPWLFLSLGTSSAILGARGRGINLGFLLDWLGYVRCGGFRSPLTKKVPRVLFPQDALEKVAQLAGRT